MDLFIDDKGYTEQSFSPGLASGNPQAEHYAK